MTPHSSAENREHLYDLLQTRTGLLMDTNRRKDLDRAVEALIASRDISHLGELMSELAAKPTDHPVWQRLIHAVTIGETYFFRNSPQLEALRMEVFPALINERRKAGILQLRIWSAGCATGEEPYSIAIMLRELLPDIEAWNISLLATDINVNFLQEARAGLYRNKSFRNETPEVVRERWFISGENDFQIKPIIQKMVSFRHLNLITDDYPSYDSSTMHMDVILCRNVTIYFSSDTTRQVASRFYRALNHNGWLVVGHSEPRADLYEGFATRNFANTVLYRKPEQVFPPQDVRRISQTMPKLVVLSKDLEIPKLNPAPLLIKPKQPDVKSSQPIVKPRRPVVEPNQPVETAKEDLWERAKTAADLEQWDEAHSWLKKAEEQGRFDPEVYYLRGLVEMNAGDIERGIQSLRQAIYCNPDFALAYYTLGDQYHKLGARREALTYWRRAQNVLARLDSQYVLPFSDDMTVEMLKELLSYRLADS